MASNGVETRTPKPETRNPKPEIRNPKPETRNPKPETRNPKPQTRNPKPQTLQPRVRCGGSWRATAGGRPCVSTTFPSPPARSPPHTPPASTFRDLDISRPRHVTTLPFHAVGGAPRIASGVASISSLGAASSPARSRLSTFRAVYLYIYICIHIYIHIYIYIYIYCPRPEPHVKP